MRNDPVPDEKLLREVEQFLYREARLLDSRRFREWLELFTDDIRYWMASRTNRYPKHSKAISILDPARYVEDDITAEDELAILDEDKGTLKARVDRLDTGMAWAEDPPSRTRHMIANIEVEAGRERRRDQGLLELYRLSQPRRERRGFLCRCPRGCPAARRRRVEDRPPQDGARPERVVGEKRQHLFLSGGLP